MLVLSKKLKDDLVKYVTCISCGRSGIIVKPYLAPKKWRRHFTLTKQKYIYYCQRCYQTYIQGKPLFEEV